ncbi:nuclease-related domain-containing protein [Paenibacillus radicis (ex Xue et al. 2023)]|uniref:NERD domain-containing protein n=1 Tax=Paenibacillus radicis (ex Xue et al. 2023) TaxID=2972489 RepID=A0ABT1YJY8_9BACL|nr:nuclease-related domain-containing protein [Paenibacillus radicis (ex Xue et al. 2023)]MCR8633513.1 NERD domain-containing protein [Paenibacillus radicis (ex Xue et al. 2023)]
MDNKRLSKLSKEEALREIERMKVNQHKGYIGELRVCIELWLHLPREYILINDLTLEITPNEFIQIDHFIISPGGLAIVETKNYSGNIHTLLSGWEYADNRKKLNTDPVKQVDRHIKLLKVWLKENYPEGVDLTIEHAILVRAKVQNNNNPKIVSSGKEAFGKIYIKGENLNPDEMKKLANMLKNAKNIDHWNWIHSNSQIKDTRVVQVTGDDNEFYKIVNIYKEKGFEVKYDREKSPNEIILKNHIRFLEEKHNEQIEKLKLESNFKFRYLWMNKKVRTFVYCCFIVLAGFFLTIDDKDGYDRIDKVMDYYNYNFTPKEVMTFKVNGDTSIKIVDGNQIITSKIYHSQSQVVFHSNKEILIQENGENTKYKLNNNKIYFEVSNDLTEVIHYNNNINAGSVAAHFYFDRNIVE